MAVNLGPEAFAAMQRLRHNDDWRAIVDALQVQMSSFMNQAVDIPIDHRVDATGYARALRDLVAHIAHVETGERMQKPVVKAREPARV